MKKLLITGFEPFGGEGINPSWQAVLALPERIGDYTLVKLCLPVVFGDAATKVLQSATELSPEAIVCVGQAGGRSAITPEFVGINLRHASIPDNRGNQPQDTPIVQDGATAYFSTLPVRKMVASIQEVGILSSVSYSAGTYVCNDLLYTLLSHFDGTDTRVGFIHVPYCTEQNKSPSMPLRDIIRGLIVAIQNI